MTLGSFHGGRRSSNFMSLTSSVALHFPTTVKLFVFELQSPFLHQTVQSLPRLTFKFPFRERSSEDLEMTSPNDVEIRARQHG